MEISPTGCCALDELRDIHYTEIKDIMIQICEDRVYDTERAFYVFTGVNKQGYGQKLKKFILDNELGTVLETRAMYNVNSGNYVKVWVWTVNNKKLRKYGSDNGVSESRYDD